MKKKFFLLLLALPVAMQGFAQTDETNEKNIDFEEDTAHVTSLNDIIAMQELVYEQSYRSKIISGVWKRKKFFTLSYANTTLTGKKLQVYNPTTKKMETQNPKYKTDWAVALKRSRTIALHKKPIANMVSFGLEFSGLDLAVNHYDKEEYYDEEAKKKMPVICFDSRLTDKTNTSKNDEIHYMPWGSEMYTFAYGMHLGPSITLAPFTKLNSPGLAHICLQTYFTLGYRASMMWMRGDDEQDWNYIENHESWKNTSGTNSEAKNYFTEVSRSSKLSWAHGLVTTWGIRLSWKGIGFGYEITKGDYDFKSTEKKIYGSSKFKFSESSKRVSLSYVF